MEKTHKVRLGGPWIFEKQYPNADPLVLRFAAGETVEIDDAAYQSIVRMNDTPGRPTLKLERLAEGEAARYSIPDMVARVNDELASRGIAVKGAERTMVQGKYKGLFQTAVDASVKAAPAGDASAEATTDAAASKKGGK